MAYTTAGDGGPPVVLVHGGAADRRDWRRNIGPLAESHQVFAPDLLGFGESDRPDARYTAGLLGEALCLFMDEVGIEQASLVGHSLGARTCLEVACTMPERVSRLVLAAPMGFGRLSATGMVLGTAAWAAYKAIFRPLPFPKLEVPLHDPDVAMFRRVAAPTLVLWGRRDFIFPPRYAERVCDLIPDSRSVLIDRAGHATHKDQPEAFNRLVLDFLQA